jgi:hypothetical protein
MSSIESIRSMTVDSPLSTKAPEYFVRLIQVHLVSKKFKNHLVRVKGQIGVYEHETMGVINSTKTPELFPIFLDFFRRLYAPVFDHVIPALILAELPL